MKNTTARARPCTPLRRFVHEQAPLIVGAPLAVAIFAVAGAIIPGDASMTVSAGTMFVLVAVAVPVALGAIRFLRKL
ncbi:hypothetical protein [Agromyces humi]|uniref:hypothetical protein n=1 Tax=Agromyces humi TaxID=1766800 RepID=UPI0013595601|nr:hypothetical protein [Agromyces humi]